MSHLLLQLLFRIDIQLEVTTHLSIAGIELAGSGCGPIGEIIFTCAEVVVAFGGRLLFE